MNARVLPFFLLLILLVACLPRTSNPLDSDQAQKTQTTAQEIYHRMEIGKLQTGDYTTNALVDVKLPQGVIWTLESFGNSTYVIRVTHQDIGNAAWLVSPEGVQFITVETGV